MVSDSELAEKVQEFLHGCNLKMTTNNIIIKKLESHFGVDLSHKKPFVRHQVDLFLQSQYSLSEELQLNVDFDAVNDAVLCSDDDDVEENNGGGGPDFSLGHNNGSTSKLQRSSKQNKVKNKKVSESDKFCTLSPELQKFLGVPHLTWTKVLKRFRSYVRDKNLQNPEDEKTIRCDEKLRDLLGVDSINILQINKALMKHVCPSDSAKSMKREKSRKQEREKDPCETDLDAKKPRKVYSGFLAPVPISDPLIKFLGTGESSLTRADVIKRVWEYIKENNLQDPCDKKTVICDDKLKELFNVDSFHGFTVSKLLTSHFVKL